MNQNSPNSDDLSIEDVLASLQDEVDFTQETSGPTKAGQHILRYKELTSKAGSGWFGITYISMRGANAGLRIPLWQTFGFPLLFESYEHAAAKLSLVQASVEPHYTGIRTEPGRKVWDLTVAYVELHTGRRKLIDENGVKRIVLTDDTRTTCHQFLAQATCVGFP